MRKDEFKFESLLVWEKSKQLIVDLYLILDHNDLPKDEDYIFKSQMKRAALSIASNIAEGSVRMTKKDKIRFLSIAYGSAVELMNQVLISFELKYLNTDHVSNFRVAINEICAMLSGLKKCYENEKSL